MVGTYTIQGNSKIREETLYILREVKFNEVSAFEKRQMTGPKQLYNGVLFTTVRKSVQIQHRGFPLISEKFSYGRFLR